MGYASYGNTRPRRQRMLNSSHSFDAISFGLYPDAYNHKFLGVPYPALFVKPPYQMNNFAFPRLVAFPSLPAAIICASDVNAKRSSCVYDTAKRLYGHAQSRLPAASLSVLWMFVHENRRPASWH